jgi:uncharacterized protein YkwD
MKNVLILIFTWPILFIGQTPCKNSCWKKESYEKYSHVNFTKQKEINQTINLDEIDYPLLHATIFFLTNKERAKRKKKIISWNKNLEIAAFNHSKMMAELNFFSHSSKIKKRKEPEDRAKIAGVTNPFIAENIAKTPLNPQDTYLSLSKKIVTQWMNSPGHKSNILSKDALELGVGVFIVKEKEFSYVYSTQNFQWFYLTKNTVSKDSSPPGWK